MSQKRKLQVFVSSTFTDLKEERQAAVEAILKAGHIPAGMELFSAGDQSQMTVIKKWIDESDVYLLLLGGRYGSIEPISGKSYTHLEYEYALENGKAVFSVIMSDSQLDEKNRLVGKEVLELQNPQKYHEFKALVKKKLVEEWNDLRDIKLAILSTLSDFAQRPELIGWVPGNEATNSGEIAEQLAKLVKENNELRAKLAQPSKDTTTYNGLSFEEVYRFLDEIVLDSKQIKPLYYKAIIETALVCTSHKPPSLIHFLWLWGAFNIGQYITSYGVLNEEIYSHQLLTQFEELALVIEGVEPEAMTWGTQSYAGSGDFSITNEGRKFILRLKLIYGTEEMISIVSSLRKDSGDSSFKPFV
ncbi:DUF4062 domain-containing protein [Nostoc sp. CHAB 5834]|nr:DUF4062 domain-containing protein [Nostoc sp. CHAB 5834]